MGIENIGNGLGTLGTGLNKLDELHFIAGDTSVKTTPKRNDVPKDVNDEEIKVGYTVAWAVTVGRSATLRVADVAEIGKDKYDTPTVKVLIESERVVYEKNPDGSKDYSRYRTEQYLKKQSVVPGDRMIIVKRK